MTSTTTRSSSGNASEEMMARLLLDIKALMLLYSSEEMLSRLVDEKITASRDPQISSFVSMIQSKKKPERIRSNLIIALGEMVLATILAVAGLTILAPSVIGLSSPNQLTTYFSQIFSAMSTQPLANPIIPVGEFLLSLVLLIGAFYNLRVAADNLSSIKLVSIQSAKQAEPRSATAAQ